MVLLSAGHLEDGELAACTPGGVLSREQVAQCSVGMARQSSIDFRGDAHKLYSQYASRSDGVIIKRQLVGLMKGLQKKGKFKFSSVRPPRTPPPPP